jgi:hypothetical protein
MRAKNKDRDVFKELLTKLNSLALNVLDEIYDARIKKKSVDFEELKAPLLAIKEIKDLVKINDKIKNNETSDLLNFDIEDLSNVTTLEEVLNEEEG